MRTTSLTVLGAAAVTGLVPDRGPEVLRPQSPVPRVEFHRDIRPILAGACFACHGAAESTRQAELRLDTADFVETLVRPGDAEGSPLFQRLTTEEPIGRRPRRGGRCRRTRVGSCGRGSTSARTGRPARRLTVTPYCCCASGATVPNDSFNCLLEMTASLR